MSRDHRVVYRYLADEKMITSRQFGVMFYLIFGYIWTYVWSPYGNLGFFITIVGLLALASGVVHYFCEDYPIDCPPEDVETGGVAS
jgi:hypothetical protein